VNDLPGVRIVQGLRDFRVIPSASPQPIGTPVATSALQRASLQVFEGDVEGAQLRVATHVVDRDDAGVGQPSRESGLGENRSFKDSYCDGETANER
jgi:hypothetical protein